MDPRTQDLQRDSPESEEERHVRIAKRVQEKMMTAALAEKSAKLYQELNKVAALPHVAHGVVRRTLDLVTDSLVRRSHKEAELRAAVTAFSTVYGPAFQWATVGRDEFLWEHMRYVKRELLDAYRRRRPGTTYAGIQLALKIVLTHTAANSNTSSAQGYILASTSMDENVQRVRYARADSLLRERRGVPGHILKQGILYDYSLNLVRNDAERRDACVDEAKALLTEIVTLLYTTNDATLVSAIIAGLLNLIRFRPQLSRLAILALAKWSPYVLEADTPALSPEAIDAQVMRLKVVDSTLQGAFSVLQRLGGARDFMGPIAEAHQRLHERLAVYNRAVQHRATQHRFPGTFAGTSVTEARIELEYALASVFQDAPFENITEFALLAESRKRASDPSAVSAAKRARRTVPDKDHLSTQPLWGAAPDWPFLNQSHKQTARQNLLAFRDVPVLHKDAILRAVLRSLSAVPLDSLTSYKDYLQRRADGAPPRDVAPPRRPTQPPPVALDGAAGAGAAPPVDKKPIIARQKPTEDKPAIDIDSLWAEINNTGADEAMSSAHGQLSSPDTQLSTPDTHLATLDRQLSTLCLEGIPLLARRGSHASRQLTAAQNPTTKRRLTALWSAMVSRIVTRCFHDHGPMQARLRDLLFRFVIADPQDRLRFALWWLTEEFFFAATVHKDAFDLPSSQYALSLRRILDAVLPSLTAQDRYFTRFIVELPVLPPYVFDFLFSLGQSIPALGVTALRELVLFRLQVRDNALDAIYSLALSPDRHTRLPAINAMRRSFFDTPALVDRMRAFSLKLLQSLVDDSQDTQGAANTDTHATEDTMDAVSAPPQDNAVSAPPHAPPHDNAVSAPPSASPQDNSAPPRVHNGTIENMHYPETQEETVQYLESVFALATKENALIQDIFAFFPRFRPAVRDHVALALGPLIRSLGLSNATLMHCTEQCLPGTELLVKRVLKVLWSKTTPTFAPAAAAAAAAAKAAADIAAARAEAAAHTAQLGVALNHINPAHMKSPATAAAEAASRASAEAPPAPLVSAARILVCERGEPLSFIVPFIAQVPKQDVPQVLPAIVNELDLESSTSRAFTKMLFEAIMGAPPQSLSVTASVGRMTPVDLLLELHKLETAVGMKKIMATIGLALELSDYFRPEIMASFLTRCADLPDIPTVFMRTILIAITKAKSLMPFVGTTILSKLAAKDVWTDPVFWKGYLLCAQRTAPNSFTAVVQLPVAQFREFAAQNPKLHDELRAFVSRKHANQHLLQYIHD